MGTTYTKNANERASIINTVTYKEDQRKQKKNQIIDYINTDDEFWKIERHVRKKKNHKSIRT